MELRDYLKEKGENIDTETTPTPVGRKKRKVMVEEEIKPSEPKIPVPEMTDEECLRFYADLSNMVYMAINPKLRHIEVEEIQPVKTAAGNVIRTLMKYIGDYRFFLDAAVMTAFTIGIYKQRKAEITIDITNNAAETDK